MNRYIGYSKRYEKLKYSSSNALLYKKFKVLDVSLYLLIILKIIVNIMYTEIIYIVIYFKSA